MNVLKDADERVTVREETLKTTYILYTFRKRCNEKTINKKCLLKILKVRSLREMTTAWKSASFKKFVNAAVFRISRGASTSSRTYTSNYKNFHTTKKLTTTKYFVEEKDCFVSGKVP